MNGENFMNNAISSGGDAIENRDFKRGNSVWRGTKIFEWRNFHEIKILHEDNVMINSKYIFWDSWAKLLLR